MAEKKPLGFRLDLALLETERKRGGGGQSLPGEYRTAAPHKPGYSVF